MDLSLKNHFLTVWSVETLSLRFRGDYFLLQNKINSVFTTDKVFPQRSMATLRHKTKLAAASRETPEGSRSSRAQNVLDPELTQYYISQVSEEIEGRVTKKLSKALAKQNHVSWVPCQNLTSFFWTHKFGLVPWLSQEHPETLVWKTGRTLGIEVGYFSDHSGQLNSPETETNLHMVTAATEEFRHHPHMMTATQEEIRYCSPTTWSSRQKKAGSISRPQFRSEKTFATIEVD